jgi:hypothetical protein
MKKKDSLNKSYANTSKRGSPNRKAGVSPMKMGATMGAKTAEDRKKEAADREGLKTPTSIQM